jgi:hypothetical protein|tara:strand:+ start:822 stop:1856 length:1035 start_codon:yes stop_codon:yes gene_type:complete
MAYSTISKPSLHFNTKLYTGNGSTQSITGVGFQPDFTWLKRRDASAGNKLTNSVRGTGKHLVSNNSNAEYNENNILTAFGTDGFSVGNSSDVNNNGNSYVSWSWKGGGSSSSNSDGDVTSTVSANQTAGFSIVSVSNLNSNSFGHGLGAEPEFIINKRTDNTANWRVYFKGISSGKSLFLNTTAAETTEGSAIASANATTVTVTGSGHGGTAGTGTAVFYCFAPKKGYSKFGKYIGNGNANGAFVYTGFKPAFTIIKRITSGDNWALHDNRRPGRNPNDAVLRSNLADAEYGGSQGVDYLSNGFKARQNDGEFNNSGETYIFMAFAEEPLVANVGANGIPATAR